MLKYPQRVTLITALRAGAIIPTLQMETLKRKEAIDLLNLVIGGDTHGAQLAGLSAPHFRRQCSVLSQPESPHRKTSSSLPCWEGPFTKCPSGTELT